MDSEIIKIKEYLYKYVYTTDNINELMEDICNTIPLFNIEYNNQHNTIQMKVKKTSIKKTTDMSGLYYNIITPIIKQFLKNKCDSSIAIGLNNTIVYRLFKLLVGENTVCIQL